MKIDSLRIKIIIAEHGLTQSCLAKKAGLSRQSVNAIIRRGTCELRTIGKLATGLGVSVSDIIAKEA